MRTTLGRGVAYWSIVGTHAHSPSSQRNTFLRVWLSDGHEASEHLSNACRTDSTSQTRQGSLPQVPGDESVGRDSRYPLACLALRCSREDKGCRDQNAS